MNFGIHELFLVDPLAPPSDAEARVWAANAKNILEKARVVGSIEEAVKGCAVVVATTAKACPKTVRRTPVSPKEFAEKIGDYWNSEERVAILFGREPSGLTNEELETADFTVSIPTSPQYPSLNLSHSVAVILYELYLQKARKDSYDPPSFQSFSLADSIFEELTKRVGRKNPRETAKAWRSVLRRGAKTDKEVRAIIGVLSELKKRCLDDC